MSFFKKLIGKKGESGSDRGRKKDKDGKGSRSSSRGDGNGSRDGGSIGSGDRRASADIRKHSGSTGSHESVASRERGAKTGSAGGSNRGSNHGSTRGAQQAGSSQAQRGRHRSPSSDSSTADERYQGGAGGGANGRGGSANSNTRARAELTYSPREQQPVSARSDLSTARPLSSTSDAPEIDSGYLVNEKDIPKLHLSAWQNKPELFKKYLSDGPNVTDRFNRTPLHLACARGNLESVRELVKEGASVTHIDANSRTPLMKAIECLHTDVVQFLVSQQRPNVNAQDSEQNSCLHLAVYASARRLPASESATSAGSARERAFEITRLLLKADAVVDKRNRDGLTPLHIVAQLGFTDAASELLRRGANVNAVDNHRRTPLMLACGNGSATLVDLLVQNGANTQLQDDKGQKAEDFAIMTNHSGLIDHLTGRVAKAPPSSAPAPAGSSAPPGSVGAGTGAAAKANPNPNAGRKERDADAGSWDESLGLDEDPARVRAAAAATKPQQPVSARSQDTLAGVPQLGSSPAVAVVREEADDWDNTEGGNAGRAGAKSAAAAGTGSGSGAAFTAAIGAPSVQEQVAVRPGGITVQAAGRSGGSRTGGGGGGAEEEDDVSDWDTSDPNAVRARANVAAAGPPLVVMPDGGTRSGSATLGAPGIGIGVGGPSGLSAAGPSGVVGPVPISATATVRASSPATIKATSLGPPLSISITERVRSDTEPASAFVSAADFGSTRASGSETPDAHTYRNLEQIAAPDVTDSGRAMRRQLEEEETRRAQVEQQMREMQARELDIKRRLEEEQTRNARLEAERLQLDRTHRSRGEQENQVVQQYEAELVRLKQQVQQQTRSLEDKLQQQRQIEALKTEMEQVRLTKERVESERQRLDRQLQHERERVAELEMRMVAGPGSSDATAPALVASTGQFASDLNLADGSPARPSGETGSVDGEEWVARHARQPTTSGTTLGGGDGGELDGSPAPGARAQPRAGNKLSRQDSTRSVEVYAIQRELEQEQSRRKTEQARWLVEKERLQANIKELENLCNTREDAMNRAALQAQIDVRQLLTEKERITKELLDTTRERDELDRQAREHLQKIDELRLEAGDRDKTATETKEELLAQIEELKQKLLKTNCDLTRMDMLIQKVYELFRLRYRMAVGNEEQLEFLQPLVAELNHVADIYNVQLTSPNGVAIRPNPGVEQLGLGASYGDTATLNAAPGPLSANALQLRDSVERLEMQLLGSVGGAVGAPATGGAGIMQPQQVPFDVNALGRRVPLAHITLPPPPAMPKKDDDSDTSSSESSDRGSKRRSKGSDRAHKHRGSKDSSSKKEKGRKGSRHSSRHRRRRGSRDRSTDEEEERKKLELQQKAAEPTPEEITRRAREAQLNAENEALLILWNEERDRAQMAADHKQRAELALGELERGVSQQLMTVSMAPPPPPPIAPPALAASLPTPLRSSHHSPHRSSHHHSRRRERPVRDEAGEGESPERGGSRSSSWSSNSSGRSRSRSRSGSASEEEQQLELERERIRLAQQQQEMANAARQQQHQQQLTGMLSSLKGQLQATRSAVATGQPLEQQYANVGAQPPGSPQAVAGLPPPGQSLPSSTAYLAAPSPDVALLGARRRSRTGHRHHSGHRSRDGSRGRRQPEKNGETQLVSQFQNLLGQHAQQLNSSLNQSLSDLKKEMDTRFVDRTEIEQLANQMEATRSASNAEAAETAQALAAEMQMRTQQLADEREHERAAQAERERRREEERVRYVGDLKKQFASSLSQMQGELSNARRAFEEQRAENSALNGENRRLFDIYRTRQSPAATGARPAPRPLAPSLGAGYSSALLLPAPQSSTAPPPAALYTKLRRDLDRSISMHLEASGASGARSSNDFSRPSLGGSTPMDSSFKGLVGGKYLLT